MMPWNAVKQLALELVQRDHAGETMQSLERWILASGYADAPDSHRTTRDLIYAYAASLRNAGGPGPVLERFATMVAATIDEHWIRINVLQPFDIRELAGRCREGLVTGAFPPMAKRSAADYPLQLQQISEGVDIYPRIMSPLLTSITAFADMLRQRYGGTADRYHQSFDPAGRSPSQFAFEKFQEIADFPKIGIAVGMNFFKDSQAPSIHLPADASISECAAMPAAWFVKPDKHVSRLMLYATGRGQMASIDKEDLTYLKDATCFALYASCPPAFGFSEQYSTLPAQAGTPQWQCIEDTHAWALSEGVAPIELDRILYLIGSGRYGERKLRTEQPERYRRFCELVDAHDGMQPGVVALRAPIGLVTRNTVAVRKPADIAENIPAVPVAAAALGTTAKLRFMQNFAGHLDAEGCVEAVKQTFLNRSDVQIHYTGTANCDLRIRAFNTTGRGRKKQNVFTMTWCKGGYFECAIYDVEDISQFDAPGIENLRGVTRPLTTAFQFHPAISEASFETLTDLVEDAVYTWTIRHSQ